MRIRLAVSLCLNHEVISSKTNIYIYTFSTSTTHVHTPQSHAPNTSSSSTYTPKPQIPTTCKHTHKEETYLHQIRLHGLVAHEPLTRPGRASNACVFLWG